MSSFYLQQEIESYRQFITLTDFAYFKGIGPILADYGVANVSFQI